MVCHPFGRLVRPLNTQPLTVVDIVEDAPLVLPELAMLIGKFQLARLLHSQALDCLQPIIDVGLGPWKAVCSIHFDLIQPQDAWGYAGRPLPLA